MLPVLLSDSESDIVDTRNTLFELFSMTSFFSGRKNRDDVSDFDPIIVVRSYLLLTLAARLRTRWDLLQDPIIVIMHHNQDLA